MFRKQASFRSNGKISSPSYENDKSRRMFRSGRVNLLVVVVGLMVAAWIVFAQTARSTTKAEVGEIMIDWTQAGTAFPSKLRGESAATIKSDEEKAFRIEQDKLEGQNLDATKTDEVAAAEQQEVYEEKEEEEQEEVEKQEQEEVEKQEQDNLEKPQFDEHEQTAKEETKEEGSSSTQSPQQFENASMIKKAHIRTRVNPSKKSIPLKKDLEKTRLYDFIVKHNLEEFLSKDYIRQHKEEAMKLVTATREEEVARYDELPFVGIRGLMSSGTNWLRSLLKKHCPKSYFPFRPYVDWDGVYGWKHGLFEQHEIERLVRNEKHTIVVLTRNAMGWAQSMRKMAIQLEQVGMALKRNRNAPMETFLQTSFKRTCPPLYSWYYERCVLPFEGLIMESSNILEWRTDFYRQMYNLSLKYPEKVIIMKYEDFRDDSPSSWAKLMQHVDADGMECEKEIQEQTKYRVKYGKETKEVFDKNNYLKAACKQFTGSESAARGFEILRENLDLELEKALGYTYESASQLCV